MSQEREIVEVLYAARNARGVTQLRREVGFDISQALGVQLEVLRRLQEDGERLAGWKVGLSTGNSRDALGEGFRPFGYILESRALRSGAEIQLATISDCRIEPELCVIMGTRLRGSDVTAQEARRSVRAIAPAFEINDVRVGMRDRPSLFVADGLANWGVVVGPEFPVSTLEEAPVVRLYRDGEMIGESAPDLPADGPFLALARLCGTLHAFGSGLEPGQLVITGAFSQDRVTRPARYRAEFTGLGAVEATFT